MSEWLTSLTELPNLHPAVVHLPLGLLPVAVIVDAASLLLRRQAWLRPSAALLYGLGAAGAWLAVLAGEQAADSLVGVPARLQPAISAHSDWGHYAAYVFAGIAAVRIGIVLWAHRSGRQEATAVTIARTAIVIVGVLGLGVLARAADMGGGLVYRQGLAVAAERQAASAPASGEPAARVPDGPATARVRIASDGTLTWNPLASDGDALGAILTAAAGSSLQPVSPVGPEESAGGEGLALRVDGRSLLLLEPTFGDLQLDVELDRSDLRGALALVHHVTDVANFESFVVDEADSAALVQTVHGVEMELDREALDVRPGNAVYSVSVAKGHLKGMIDGATVVHGHAPSLPGGRVGILMDGRGVVRIRFLAATPL